MSRWEGVIDQVTMIRDECLGKQKEDDKDSELDAFTRQKKKIGGKIKKIREVIGKRDNFIKSNMQIEAIKYSNIARIQIADVYEDAEHLKQIHEKDEQKHRKKAQEDEGFRQLLTNRSDIIRLTFAHIQECEMLESQREQQAEKQSKQKRKLFELKERPKKQNNDDNSYGIVKLPDIDKIPDISVQEGFDKQDENDKKIDGLLDDVLKGVVDLKEYANTMSNRIEISNTMIDDISVNVDQANEQLRDINLQLKKTLKKIRSPKKICFDICLCLLFLGLIALIIKVIYDRR
eukprot:TRINITY_DN843_c0_g1_i1.p1 TRINITY_DN843_c0_g1~~TRINITY_DN843_c0_g1_i1.p1  ORF type:complete len:290 (-),score=90.10 TRINITY_DN843_c0_g1_i1:115-984(-)